jgi:hypothetical protein
MTKEELKANYEFAANAYLKAFCEKHDYEFEQDCWVGNEAGGIAMIADYSVGMQTIIDDIDMDAPENEFLAWYDYCLAMYRANAETTPNYRSWLRGCPRKTQAEINELNALQARIDELKEEIEALAKENKNHE